MSYKTMLALLLVILVDLPCEGQEISHRSEEGFGAVRDWAKFNKANPLARLLLPWEKAMLSNETRLFSVKGDAWGTCVSVVLDDKTARGAGEKLEVGYLIVADDGRLLEFGADMSPYSRNFHAIGTILESYKLVYIPPFGYYISGQDRIIDLRTLLPNREVARDNATLPIQKSVLRKSFFTNVAPRAEYREPCGGVITAMLLRWWSNKGLDLFPPTEKESQEIEKVNPIVEAATKRVLEIAKVSGKMPSGPEKRKVFSEAFREAARNAKTPGDKKIFEAHAERWEGDPMVVATSLESRYTDVVSMYTHTNDIVAIKQGIVKYVEDRGYVCDIKSFEQLSDIPEDRLRSPLVAFDSGTPVGLIIGSAEIQENLFLLLQLPSLKGRRIPAYKGLPELMVLNSTIDTVFVNLAEVGLNWKYISVVISRERTEQ